MKGQVWVILFLATLLVAFPGITWAEEEGEMSEESEMAKEKSQLPSFKEADKNGDGRLSFEEAKELGISKKTFKEEDLDSDGELTEYDYEYGVK